MIHLVGPGAAGKTTVGLALAKRLGIGDISAYLSTHEYQAHAANNIQIYLDALGCLDEGAVIALSSGFMTYPDDAHPAYRGLWQHIVSRPSTVVLLPSVDYETCVSETVRRQLRPPFRRSAEREEQVIRARFEAYCGLPTKKFETSRKVNAVVEELVACLPPNAAAARDADSGSLCTSRGVSANPSSRSDVYV